MDIAAIHQEASEAARKAADEMYQRMGGDRLMCGFAWVNIYGVSLATKQGKEFAKIGFRKGYGRKAPIELWNPSRHNAQNVDIKEAGARAYAEVFKRHGFEAYAGSRLD